MSWVPEVCRARRQHAHRLADPDQGSVVVGWLTRIVLVAAILGIAGFELLSIVVAKVEVEDVGQTAAYQALDQYQASRSSEQAYQVASAYAEEHGSQIPEKSFKIDDGSVTFKLDKTATTLFLYRWDTSAKWAQIRATIYAEPLASGGSLS